MKKLISVIILVLFFYQGEAQSNSIDYFGQTSPEDSAVIFAPGLISQSTRKEYKITFSPDGSECYLGFWVGNTGKVHCMKNENGTWSEAFEPTFSAGHNVSALTFSTSGNKLFANYDNNGICSFERTASGWDTVNPLTAPVNINSYHYAETADSVMFVASTRSGSTGGSIDLWCIKRSADRTLKATNMENVINTSSSEFAPCVSSDGSYLIFTSDRTGSIGKQDLYIAFKKNDGSYTPAINMEKTGSSINVKNYHQTFPSLSPDEKYLFFSRHEPDLDPWDIYWLNIEKVVPALKQIVFTPKVANIISNVTITTDSTLTLVIPETTFSCEYGTSNLSYSATLKNDATLPVWLTFEASTRTFKGKPTKAETDTIVITATNIDGVSASCTFQIEVLKATNISRLENLKVEIYPNPTNDRISISLGNLQITKGSVSVYSTDGRRISFQDIHTTKTNIDLTEFPNGIYIVGIAADGHFFMEKICKQ